MSERLSIEALRQKEHDREPLSRTERAELDAFYQRVEQQEASYLNPLLERFRQEREERTTYIQELQVVRDKMKDSVLRLQALVREIESLQQEEARILTATVDH